MESALRERLKSELISIVGRVISGLIVIGLSYLIYTILLLLFLED